MTIRPPGIQTAAEKGIHRTRMDIRGPDRASNAPCCLDLLRGHLRLSIGVLFGLDSRPHPRIAGCCSNDLFMAVGSGSGSVCDLPSVRRSSRVIDLHRLIRRHHRNRNDLVVACSEQQVLKWTIGAGDPIDQFMRIQIEPHADVCTENSNSDIMVMQSAKDCVGMDTTS